MKKLALSLIAVCFLMTPPIAAYADVFDEPESNSFGRIDVGTKKIEKC